MDFRVRLSGHLLPPVAVKALIVGLVVAALVGVGAPAGNSAAWLVGILPLFAMVSVAFILSASRASERVRVIGVTSICAVVAACATYVTVLTSPTSSLWPQVLICMGVGVFYAAFRARDGDVLHCTLCDYPFNAARVCPECGNDWTQTNSLRHGTRRRRPWMAGLGAVVIVVGALLLTGPLLARAAWSVAPTSLLVTLAGTPNADPSILRELDARQLSPQQRVDLSVALMNLRERGVMLDLQQAMWLDQTSRANVWSPPMSERYFSGLVPLSLRVVGTPKVGESLRIEIVSSAQDSARTLATWMSAWVTGWWIDDGKVADAWPDWDSVARFDERLVQTMPTSGPNHLPGLTISPTNPGVIRLRVVVWLVASPARPALVLGPDGVPRFGGASTPVWSKQVELTASIDVLP